MEIVSPSTQLSSQGFLWFYSCPLPSGSLGSSLLCLRILWSLFRQYPCLTRRWILLGWIVKPLSVPSWPLLPFPSWKFSYFPSRATPCFWIICSYSCWHLELSAISFLPEKPHRRSPSSWSDGLGKECLKQSLAQALRGSPIICCHAYIWPTALFFWSFTIFEI